MPHKPRHENKWLFPRASSSLAGLVLLLLPLFPAGGAPLSFPDALTQMKSNNESLLAAREEIRQRDEEVAAARGMRYPKVEIDIKETFLNDPITIGIDPIPFSLEVQSDEFTKGQVRASLPLYAGGRIDAANQAAQAQQADSMAQTQVTEDQLVTELATRYFGLTLSRAALDVQTLKVRAMEDHTYRAQRLMEEGIIARVEFLNASVALSNAQTEQQAASRDVGIVTAGLTNIIAGQEDADPSTPLFLLRNLETREQFQGYLDERHPILDMVAAKRDLAHQGTRVEKGAGLPTLYLFGMHELVPDDLTMLDPEWAVGVGMSYTLFDGFQTKHKVEAARAREQRVAYIEQKARRDLGTLVLKRYEEMEKAREQFDSYDATLALTQENLRARTRAFEEGLATSIEVVDATVTHARAQLGRLKAAYDFDVAFFQLLEASGRSNFCQDYLLNAVEVLGPEVPAAATAVEAPAAVPAPAEQ